MKRFMEICIWIFCAAIVLSGCGPKTIDDGKFHEYKPQTNTDLETNPDILAEEEKLPVNESYDYRTFKTTHSPYNIQMLINGDTVRLSGTFDNDTHKFLLITFERNSEEGKTSIEVINCKFDAVLKVPSSKDEYVIEIYGGPEKYGNFESIFIDFGKILKTSDGWQFEKSPVYDSNQSIYNKSKDPGEYRGATDTIQSDSPEISSLASRITSGIESDYEKIKAIHDWAAENIFYDMDALKTKSYSRMDALSVLEDKKGVCEGYSNLVAALVRSIGIPCRVQGGYALGIDTNGEWSENNINTTEGNHAWNEAYVDGRWVIMDCTWDSKNKYENGSFNKGGEIGNIYFDSTLEFFSLSHKLLKD